MHHGWPDLKTTTTGKKDESGGGGHSEDPAEVADLVIACFMSGIKEADTLSDLMPALSRSGIVSGRPASSPHKDTGVSSASLTINSISRRITGWSSRKYSVTIGFSRPAAIVYWVRSLEPMLKKSTCFRREVTDSAAAGVSIIAPRRGR